MRKLLHSILIVGLFFNIYWIHRYYIYTKKLTIYFTYAQLQADCSEAAAAEHDDQIVKLSNKKLKPMGNILHVYLAYIPECQKLAEYRCWMSKSDEDQEKCQERRKKEDELFKQ